MIGSIEDLEKEIEQFQNNVMASGELVALLNQMLEQIKAQNESFEQKSSALISKVDSLPTTIDTANSSSNARIKADVTTELDRFLQSFISEQNRYMQGLEQTRQQIQTFVERSNSQEKVFLEKIGELLSKLDSVMDQIKEDNLKVNDDLKKSIDKLLENRNAQFIDEQSKYLQSLAQTRESIKSQSDQLQAAADGIIEKNRQLITKADSVLEQMRAENTNAVSAMKKGNDEIIANRNAEFAEEQGKYIAALQETQTAIKSSETKLASTYREFMDTLDKMNIANLYEQNQQLKSELNKRTTILMIIAAVSVVLGIIGLII